MAEPPELYRQQEAYHQDTEQAAPRGWLRGIAYTGLLGAVSFGIGFFANKYFSERREDRTAQEQNHGVEESSDETTLLNTGERDGTLETRVVENTGIIRCTEEDIRVTEHLFGITPKPE